MFILVKLKICLQGRHIVSIVMQTTSSKNTPSNWEPLHKSLFLIFPKPLTIHCRVADLLHRDTSIMNINELANRKTVNYKIVTLTIEILWRQTFVRYLFTKFPSIAHGVMTTLFDKYLSTSKVIFESFLLIFLRGYFTLALFKK